MGVRWVAGLVLAWMPAAMLGQGAPVAPVQMPIPAPVQTPVTAPMTSPQAAYDAAILPVEITHRAVTNWSDTETAALGVAVGQARQACAARSAVAYVGEDLIGYARLCALGQQWPAVVGAAGAYLKVAGDAGTQKTQAHAYLVEGALHMNDEKSALARSLDMLGAVPYTVLVDEVMGEALRYLQLAFTADALVLAGVREETVLRLLRAGSEGKGAAAADVVPVHALYADGLQFAAMEQYDGQMEAAAATVAELTLVLPAGLGADETVSMAAAMRQYGMLGTRLPEIGAAASLFSPTETPRINRRFGTATILLLFPPWCAQCVRMGKDLLPAMARLNSDGAEVHLYGLLAGDPPPVAGAPAGGRRKGGGTEAAAVVAGPKTAAEILRGTPTLVVSPAVLGQFGAEDFPFVIATDHDGIIRLLLSGAPENAMVAGSTVDQIAVHVATRWPVAEEP